MTVSESDISIVSMGRYVVDSSGNFTPGIFNSFLSVATARLALDAPGLTGALADRAIALLVCHFVETGKGQTNQKGISVGSTQASYDDSGSSFMKEYREIITAYNGSCTDTTSKTTAKAKGGIRVDAGWLGI